MSKGPVILSILVLIALVVMVVLLRKKPVKYLGCYSTENVLENRIGLFQEYKSLEEVVKKARAHESKPKYLEVIKRGITPVSEWWAIIGDKFTGSKETEIPGCNLQMEDGKPMGCTSEEASWEGRCPSARSWAVYEL